MSDWLKVIILGIVEGLTQFLPISSTGHLIVAGALLEFRTNLFGTFEIFIQLGAVIAVVAYYRNDLLQQVKSVRTDVKTQRLWLALVIAVIPAALVGLLLENWIKATLFSPTVVAVALIVGGLVFLLIERGPLKPPAPSSTQLTDITFKQALVIGLAQTTALVPGVSRSGATIVGGMLGGLDRTTATQFSFYLAIPILGLATIFDLLSNVKSYTAHDLLLLLLGLVVSGIVAWFSIGWLLQYVARHSFVAFGFYRIGAGLLILLLVLLARV